MHTLKKNREALRGPVAYRQPELGPGMSSGRPAQTPHTRQMLSVVPNGYGYERTVVTH